MPIHPAYPTHRRGDEFYRTLWESEEIPLGPFDVSRITLEFLCNGSVSIKADDSRYYSYGTYSPDKDIAALQSLKLFLDGYEISFIEAHRNEDTLFLLWSTRSPQAFQLQPVAPKGGAV